MMDNCDQSDKLYGLDKLHRTDKLYVTDKLCEQERRDYEQVPLEELIHRIKAIKTKYGSRLQILGHLYQRAGITDLADLYGDSFQLSSAAAQVKDCEAIVFCGVHFMAETADILANSSAQTSLRGGRRVSVIIPDPNAGCAMADMATREDVTSCWQKLQEIIDIQQLIPVTYVNSSAELKAFCGRHGGIACTSTNAESVLQWAFQRGTRVLFFPDQHLGRNTALKMGLNAGDMAVWNHTNPHLLQELQHLKEPIPQFDASLYGGNSAETIIKSRIILWNGFCPVHQHFTPANIDRCRKEDPKARIVVHPECKQDTVRLSDYAGSTSMIINTVKNSDSGSSWYIGTEYHLIEHVMKNDPQHKIHNLASAPQFCPTMNLIDLPKLCWVLERWDAQKEVPLVRVEEKTAKDALICLERMLSCT